MTDLAPLPPSMTGTELIVYVNGLIERMNAAGGVDMPLIPLPSPWEDVRPAIDAIEDRLARWERVSPEMADVLYAYQQGQDATDLTVAALVNDATGTRAALDDWLGRVAGMVADDVTDNRGVLQARLDQGGTVIVPPADDWYVVAGSCDITVPGTVLVVEGVKFRQATDLQTSFRVMAPDVEIRGTLRVHGSDDPVMSGLTGMPWQGSIILSQWTALHAYSEAHRLKVDRVHATGMSSAVLLSGWSSVADAAAAAPAEDISIGEIRCADVEFGLAAKATLRLTVGSISGTYGVATAPRPGHLLYLAEGAGYNSGHIQPSIGPCMATDGTTGQAFQIKGVRGGGMVGALTAHNCEGSLNLMNNQGLTLQSLRSTLDQTTSTYGSVTLDATTTLTDITIGNVSIEVATDGRAVRIVKGERVEIAGIDATVNHTTTGSANAYDVEVGGTDVTVGRIAVRNLGPKAWRAVGLWGTGVGNAVKIDRLTGVFIGVDARSAAAIIDYDPERIELHPTDGFTATSAIDAPATWRAFSLAALLADPRVLAADNFTLPVTSLKITGATISGHMWENYAGMWRIVDGERRCYESTGAPTCAQVVNAEAANVSVTTGFTTEVSEGVVFRAIDASNYLYARYHRSGSQLQILKRVAGVNTVLVSSASTARTLGKRCRITVEVVGNDITATIDGAVTVTHTLSGGDEVTFAGATRHGLYANTSTTARFDTFRVDSL